MTDEVKKEYDVRHEIALSVGDVREALRQYCFDRLQLAPDAPWNCRFNEDGAMFFWHTIVPATGPKP